MKTSRFTETQTISIVKEADAGDKVKDVCRRHGIEIRYIQPGKPNQNAFIERFNKSYRDEVLNAQSLLDPGPGSGSDYGMDTDVQRVPTS
jgi:transposase InsO family protein